MTALIRAAGIPMSKRPQAVHLIFIAAPMARIWETLTSETESPKFFFGNRMTFGSAVGEPFQVRGLDGNGHVDGEVLALEPGKRIKVSWKVKAFPDLPVSEFDFLIEPEGEVCRLTVLEFHLGPVPERFAAMSRDGWALILSSLKTLIETGSPMPNASVKPPE
jgi:uncharacterized protein YndB with AHSA1/START domain